MSLVYDHSQGKTVPGYEVLTLGRLTPRNFWPVDFDFRFSHTAPAGAEEPRHVKARGETARHLKAGKEFTKPALALNMLKAALAQGIPVLCLLVDAWFTSLKFCQVVEETGKLTFLERLWHRFSTFLTTILSALADFCDSDPRFRSYLDIITNTFNQFSPFRGSKLDLSDSYV